MKTITEIRDYCRSLYYVEDLNGNEETWKPFKNYTREQINEYVENDTESMCLFLDIEYIKPSVKIFRVWYKSIDYLYVDVEAGNEEEAEEKAFNIDGGDYIPDEGVGTWEFLRVENKEKIIKSFKDDKDKMRDFKTLSKEDFLASYSYLTEEEYDLTEKEER